MSKSWTCEDDAKPRENFFKRHMIKIDAGHLVFQSALLGIQAAAMFSGFTGERVGCAVASVFFVCVAWNWLMKTARILPALKKQGEGV